VSVTLEIEDGIATVTLARPSVLNAMDRDGKRRLAEIWRWLSRDDESRVIIVTGEGPRAFCAGSDIKEIRATGESATTEELLAALPNSGVVELEQPVIAAVNGLCLGFGVTMALHCDLRLASANATFAMPEVEHGMISALTSVTLPGLIPAAHAMELLLLAEPIAADRAERLGLVSRVVPEGDALREARRWAARLRDFPAIGLRETKRLSLLARHALREQSAEQVAAARERIEASLAAGNARTPHIGAGGRGSAS
jgi:enoyl-CoA hydratase/carnithine racemase